MKTPTADDEALLGLLDAERAAFLTQFQRVPVPRRTERPGEGQWSAAEIAEHLARVEGGVARMITSRATSPLTNTPTEVAAAQMTPDKVAAVRVRSSKLQSPERVLPGGTLTADEAVAQLAGARAAMRAAFLTADPLVLDGALFPHPFIGPLTLRAWVELVAHHDARHAEQMSELADHWSEAH